MSEHRLEFDGVPVGWIRDVLRSGGTISDAEFDQLYPRRVRERSERYWTPVGVALRVAALVAPKPHTRVLDVGAGCGKLCCLAALASDGLWCGVERDPDLVATSYAASIMLGVDHRTSFALGDMTTIDWTAFDALYFYNPFEAALFAGGALQEPFDSSLQWMMYNRELAIVEDRLAEMPSGTRIVTYQGFGGSMPSSFVLAYRDPVGAEFLSLWIKR